MHVRFDQRRPQRLRRFVGDHEKFALAQFWWSSRLAAPLLTVPSVCDAILRERERWPAGGGKVPRARLVVVDLREIVMRIDGFAFGSIQINGATYERDVVIDRGKVHERKKKPSKSFRNTYGHTPLSIEEKIPWKCRRLVVGTGVNGALTVMKEVKREAERRDVELLTRPTPAAIEILKKQPRDTNAILHVTC